MSDVLQAHRFRTVVERDTSAMCPHGHSMDKGLRVPVIRKLHREAHQPAHRFRRAEGANGRSHGSAAKPRSPWITRRHADRSEGADEHVMAVTSIRFLPSPAVNNDHTPGSHVSHPEQRRAKASANPEGSKPLDGG